MAARPAAAAVRVLCLELLGTALPLHAQAQRPLAAPSRIDPAIQEEIDRLYAADQIEQGRGFRALEAMGPKAAPAVTHLILGDESKVSRPNPPGFWEAIGWTSKGNAAAMTLAKIGEPAVDPLINALGDRNRLVRSRAARTLHKITGQDFKENQTAWRNWRRTHPPGYPKGP